MPTPESPKNGQSPAVCPAAIMPRMTDRLSFDDVSAPLVYFQAAQYQVVAHK